MTQIVAQVREELAAELRDRVRSRLREQPAEWLVDQLMALVLRPEDTGYTIPRQVPRGPAAGEGLPLLPSCENDATQTPPERDGDDDPTHR
ncbi:hypothetical protein ABGB17_35595 [Sphaerisporangium sp. B11E5]|uniref:hypothetical protein n=1 Tax=Sphaerisporangium sp. B11E5 TaxID=3153563 RepID=UPI00325CD5CD